MSNDRVDELREIVRVNRPETPNLSTAIRAAVDRQASALRTHQKPDSASVPEPTGSEDTMPATGAPEGPVYTAEAYTAVEKASTSLRSLYAPSVLDEAAALLSDLWAAGERHGVTPKEWDWAVSLAGGALEVIASRYTRTPDTERTGEEVFALRRDLIEALTSDEIGLTARTGSRTMTVVDRLPETPRGGYHGDASLVVGIYSNGGWDISMNADGATVVSIAAPATKAGAAEVAALVRAVARGELGNPFRR
ncbi:hypothetical protein TPA0906_00640 [Streptomyces olivaceus]|uniref:hypothetical protein n=1 Tax=Streptomyces olivaceus TaxID=47716 RepID=UPI0022EF835A|nr:hypothetical protein [Streptomyces olivaceus]GHI98198.1 hypothetical protein TPA0906_00640 [Streptomyces olivaceus]